MIISPSSEDCDAKDAPAFVPHNDDLKTPLQRMLMIPLMLMMLMMKPCDTKKVCGGSCPSPDRFYLVSAVSLALMIALVIAF